MLDKSEKSNSSVSPLPVPDMRLPRWRRVYSTQFKRETNDLIILGCSSHACKEWTRRNELFIRCDFGR